MFELIGFTFAVAIMIMPIFVVLLIIENFFKRR